MATTTMRRERRSQAHRRAETRAALLDATVASLVTYGYAKTTTGRIAELAGLSRGAQLPYFRNRAEMVTAAVAHLAQQRIAAFTDRLREAPATVEECLDALWEGHRGPIFDAALELWVAARTDEELRTELNRVEREVSMEIMRTAESALGDQARRPGFADDLLYALAAIRGLALLHLSNGAGSRSHATRWHQTRRHLVAALS
jgi:AcrR family transcriptional regulator